MEDDTLGNMESYDSFRGRARAAIESQSLHHHSELDVVPILEGKYRTRLRAKLSTSSKLAVYSKNVTTDHYSSSYVRRRNINQARVGARF